MGLIRDYFARAPFFLLGRSCTESTLAPVIPGQPKLLRPYSIWSSQRGDRAEKTKEEAAKDHDPLNAWRRPFEEVRKQEPLLGRLHDWYVESVRSAIAEDEPSAEASLS